MIRLSSAINNILSCATANTFIFVWHFGFQQAQPVRKRNVEMLIAIGGTYPRTQLTYANGVIFGSNTQIKTGITNVCYSQGKPEFGVPPVFLSGQCYQKTRPMFSEPDNFIKIIGSSTLICSGCMMLVLWIRFCACLSTRIE